MFEHRFLPLNNDDSFKNPPPPLKDNHRVCDRNAMLAFRQEQISHYTTADVARILWIYVIFPSFIFLVFSLLWNH